MVQATQVLRRFTTFTVAFIALQSIIKVSCLQDGGGFLTGPEQPQSQHYGVISIAGAFTRTLSAGAEAARLAARDINRHNVATNQKLIVNLTEAGETLCNPPQTLAVVQNVMRKVQIQQSIFKPVILSGCPQDCYQIADEIASEFDAVTMCYGISTPTLNGFPSYDEPDFHQPQLSQAQGLYILEPNVLSVVIPLVKFVQKFGWRKVAILSNSGNFDELSLLADTLRDTFTASRVQAEPNKIEQFDSSNEGLLQSLDLIQRQNFRIIFVVVDGDVTARKILCQIYHRQMYDPKTYVWFFIGPSLTGKAWLRMEKTGGNLDPIYQLDCDCKPEELVRAADGHFRARPSLWNPALSALTVSNKTPNTFRNEMYRVLSQTKEHVQADFDEAALAYDAVWASYIAIANGLSTCLSGGITGGPCHINLDDSLNGITFPGMSGNVAFHSGRRSIQSTTVVIEKFRKSEYQSVALHYNFNYSFTWMQTNPFDGVAPGDGYELSENPGFIIPGETPIPGRPCKNSAISRSENNIVLKYFINALFLIVYKFLMKT